MSFIKEASDENTIDDFLDAFRRSQYEKAGLDYQNRKNMGWYKNSDTEYAGKNISPSDYFNTFSDHYLNFYHEMLDKNPDALALNDFQIHTIENITATLDETWANFPEEDISTLNFLEHSRNCWEDILNHVHGEYPAKDMENYRQCVITTAPMGRLGCYTYHDNNNNYALILDDLIDNLYRPIIKLIGANLEITEGRRWETNWILETIRKNDKRYMHFGMTDVPTFKHALMDIVDQYCLKGKIGTLEEFYLYDIHFIAPSNEEERLFTAYTYRGLKTFLLAHEYIHLENHTNEYDLSQPLAVATWDGIIADKSYWKLRYPHEFEWPSDHEITRKWWLQDQEFEADVKGLELTLNLLINDKKMAENPTLIIYAFIGILLPFFVEELIDRTLFLKKTGHDCYSSSLYHSDLDIYNLIVRDTHPCPRSRYENVLGFTKKILAEEPRITSHTKNKILDLDRVLFRLFDRAWNYYFSGQAENDIPLKGKIAKRFRDRVPTIVGNRKVTV